MQVGMDFEGLLDRFWMDLGPKLGGKLGQGGTKIERIRAPRRHQKIIKNQVTRVAAGRRRPEGVPY